MSKKSSQKSEINIKNSKETAKTELRRDIGLLAAILLLTVLIYSNSLANQFIYFDDPESVVNNPYIRQINLENLVHYFTTPVQYMYMPAALVSWAVDYQIGQLDPFIYHLDNLILHLCCVILVFWVFRLLTKNARMALFVTLLFAIHPVNVDSVAWVATRTNLLVTLFYLGALLCYSLYIEKNYQTRYLVLACLSFVLAACAKSSAVVLPLTLLLWDYFYDRKWDKRLLLEKIPFLVIALFFGILTLTMRVDVGQAAQENQYNLLDRGFIFFYTLADYCLRLLFPLQLSMSYAYPVKDGPWLPLHFYLAPLILALIVWGLYKLNVSKKVLIVGLSFFVLNVALSQSVLLIDNFMANRYIYLAYLGLYLILADINERILGAGPVDLQHRLRVGWVAVLVVFVAGFALLTYNRNFVWYDSITLFDDVIQKQPGIAWVHGTRGLVKFHTNDFEGARRDFDQSLKLDPGYAPALGYRGVLNYRTQDYQAALADLDKAIARAPAIPGFYRDRGKIKLALQDNQGALDDFNQAIALSPQSPEAYFQRGIARLNLNDKPGGCADIAKALSLGYIPPADQVDPNCS